MRVAIIGAGRVGMALAEILVGSGKYHPVLIDGDEEAIDRADAMGLQAQTVDSSHHEAFVRFLSAFEAVVAAVPDSAVTKIAQAAVAARAHYLDFSVETQALDAMRAQLRPGQVFRPGCGISPGLVSDIATGMIATLEGPIDLDIRVGSLPPTKSNRLGYSNIWSVDGLISEYTTPCEAIRDGILTTVLPRSNYETLELGGITYEAFTTAGGLNTLSTFRNTRVRNLLFRTIRYPGHLEAMSLLLDDLRLSERLDLLRVVLSNGLPVVSDDKVIIHVTAQGLRNGTAATAATTVTVRGIRTGSTVVRSGLICGSAAYAAAVLESIRSGHPASGDETSQAEWNAQLRASTHLGPLLEWVET